MENFYLLCERGLYVEPLQSNLYSPELLEIIGKQEANIFLIKCRHFLHFRTYSFFYCVYSYRTHTLGLECILFDGDCKQENCKCRNAYLLR